MSIEVILFVVIGAVAVASAVAMLLSENAVHSALFLILNFGCVAFLFILLNASFLALVQIAVYAGAIMVLFLFVIMLLGAENVIGGTREFRWVPPVVLTLALSFLIAFFFAANAGDIDDQEVTPSIPQVRFVHAAPDFPEADVYLNGELMAAGVDFRDATSYVDVEPGEYEAGIAVAGDEPEFAFPVGTVEIDGGEVSTIVAHGEGRLPTINVIEDDVTTVEGRQGRLAVFNAYDAETTISLVDPGSDLNIDPEEEVDVLVGSLGPGEFSDMQLVSEGELRAAVVPTDNSDDVLLRLRDFEIERNSYNLIVVSAERDLITEELRPVLVQVPVDALLSFGGPGALGQLLFVDYVLPFQMVALLLLAAMVGVIVLTHREEVQPKPGRATRRKVSRPLSSVIASQTGSDVSDPMAERPQLGAPESPQEREPSGD